MTVSTDLTLYQQEKQMRKFFSYGPIDKDMHYYAPREDLIAKAWEQVVGENPDKGGHYITVWAPRQTGKSWIMQQILWKLQKDERFDVLKLNLEHLKTVENTEEIVISIAEEIIDRLKLQNFTVKKTKEFENLFKKEILQKPLILIMDEFDALTEDAISTMAKVFRNVYNLRRDDPRPSSQKQYLLHGLALIGVRSVLGIENVKGSPFNVQRSLHIPNLTFEEVETMFRWYEKDSGQKVEQEVIERLFYETRGQPGLTGWFGELLTETYNEKPDAPIDIKYFEFVYMMGTQALPNVNIINIISKARQEPYRELVLQLFKTNEKILFRYDSPGLNFLYMNGIISPEQSGGKLCVRFSSPFVQKRLFNYFSDEFFDDTGKLHEPFEDLSDVYTETGLNIRNLMHRHQEHTRKNREWLLRDVPRRKDLRPFEAVFHFNLYRFLCDFLGRRKGQVFPEFPTGNGKVDLLIRFQEKIYALEVKSYTDEVGYREALEQAAKYGKQLHLDEIHLVFFVEYADEANRKKYEQDYTDEETGVIVKPVFVETGN